MALGYFPVAVSFGVVAARAGLSLLEAALLSLVVFAGASQFVAVALVAGGAGPLVTFLSLLAMNVRHVFYGPSLTGRLGGRPVPGRPWL
ncbi:MAG TPA: AzlC family ABC transporter permease [Trueperaceae bacterium]|nr:AzlC family ABC transporter permease [Trueperaceae bacterium]